MNTVIRFYEKSRFKLMRSAWLLCALSCIGLQARQHVAIESPLLRALDQIGAIHIPNLKEFIKDLERVLDLDPLKKLMATHSELKMVDLVALEKEGKIADPVRQKMLLILINALAEAIEPHVNALHKVRSSFERIVSMWADKSGKDETLLLAWSHVDHGKEELFFRNEVKSFEQLYNFLIELDCFLRDLIYSSPISCKKYTGL